MRLAGAGIAIRMALHRFIRRLAIAGGLGILALVALIGAVGSALAALFYRLTYSMSEPQAALIIAAILLAVALLLAGIAVLVWQRPARRPDGLSDLARRASEGLSGHRSLDPRGLLERLPVSPTTILGALALGIIIGLLRRRPPRR